MSTAWIIKDTDLSGMRRFAAFLALLLKPGDVVALSGELGAGKTTLARDVIRAILDDDTLEIPSPTFSLVQSYPDGRLPLLHVDCYRMENADELQEIGLDDALNDGVALIEWPERIGEQLPDDRIEIGITDGASDDTRTLAVEGAGVCTARVARLKAMMAFCGKTEWAKAHPRFLQGDASTRAYARLMGNGETVILMDSPARPDGAPVRDGKPYSQLVHLAEDVRPFVALGGTLEAAGLSVPHVHAQDLENGFLITEDLGDRVFSWETGDDPGLDTLYSAAVEVLVHLKSHPPDPELPLSDGQAHTLPPYDRATLEFEAELLLEWYYPAIRGEPATGTVRAAFLDVLRPVLDTVIDRDQGWVLRDYHSPNLLWLPDREGIRRVGVIDFQDALRGPVAYDLVSLLQDARRDISEDLEEALFAHYCRARAESDSTFDEEEFAAAYAVLGAQRNCKILGIFARLAKRDGKYDYLAHIPRVSAYLQRCLAHPAVDGLRHWFDAHLPESVRGKPSLD